MLFGGFYRDGRRKKQEVLKTISVGVYQFWSNHVRGFLQENLTDGNLQRKDLAENGDWEVYWKPLNNWLTFPRRWFQTRKSTCFNLALSWEYTPGHKIAALNSPWFFCHVQPVFQIETTTYRLKKTTALSKCVQTFWWHVSSTSIPNTHSTRDLVFPRELLCGFCKADFQNSHVYNIIYTQAPGSYQAI